MIEEIIGRVVKDWQYLTLGEVCRLGGGDIQTGPFGSQLHASDYVADGIPSIMPVNIGDNRISDENIARVTKSDAERLKRYRVQVGDIIYSRRGDVERRSLIRQRENGWLCGTGCLRVRIGKAIADPEFTAQYLGHPAVREWIVRHAHGATMPNLNTSILAACPFVLPPMTEQTAIASVLGAFDDKIELNRRMNETLEAMARAIFKDWFVDFGPTRAKMEGRAPYLAPDIWSLFPDRLDEEGKPEGWVQIPFEELLSDSIGGDWGDEKPTHDNPTGVRIVRGTDLKELASGTTGKVPLRFTSDRKIESRHLIDLDILIEISGGSPTQPTGRSLLITQSMLDRFIEPVTFATFCRRFRPKSRNHALLGALHLTCLYESGGTWGYQNQSTGISNFQTQRFLSSELLMWPDTPVAKAFSSIVEPMIRKTSSNENIMLAATRDLLLPKLMSGEIRVRDAEKLVDDVA